MRLNSIKLAGFKSFVDPTTMVFQSNLTAIVGPNGCGKSNIVDAIHYVLGSTSKNLRAETMTHVIFNGTENRKPVAQSAIELIFDNNEGRITGEYAQYPEISIRRELNRDGQSNYYLNGVRCRRRDITDIFLGTGLGNNSYAIIEQGMISRLIEAKPEELRAHVEEAAGTSKYKERRRETENRIKHTRENLDRLNDIREEQAKQLTHLQRQASAAEKYKALKSEQRLLRAQLQMLLIQGLDEHMMRSVQCIQEEEVRLEEQTTQLHHNNKEMEVSRSARIEQNDIVNEIQSQYYVLGSEISRIEQQINHAKERKRQLENDKDQLETSLQEFQEQHFEDENQLAELTQEMSNLEKGAHELQQKAQESDSTLKQCEFTMHDWQEQWDEFNLSTVQASKQIEVDKTKIQHLQQKQESLQQRIIRIEEEQLKQDSEGLIQELLILKEQREEYQTQLNDVQAQLHQTQENILAQRKQHQELQLNIANQTKLLNELQGKYASLEALQEVALGKNDSESKKWLAAQNLSDAPRLAEKLQVEAGWEIAVEMVLAKNLEAVCVDDFTHLNDAILELQNTDIAFFNLQAKHHTSSNNTLTSLASKVHSEGPVTNILSHIYTAESLAQALDQLPHLKSYESIITPDGIWLNTTWLHVAKSSNEKTGVLHREQELKQVQKQIHTQQEQLDRQTRYYQEAQQNLHALEERRDTLQQRLQEINTHYNEMNAQVRSKDTFIEQLKRTQAQLSQDLQENLQQSSEVEIALTEAKKSLNIAQEQALEDTAKRENLLSRRDTLRAQLEETRNYAHLAKQKSDESQVRIETLRNQIHYLNQNISRVEKQLATTQEKCAQIEQALAQISDPLPQLSIELQQALEKRAIIENDLTNARQKLNNLEEALGSLEKNRQAIESQVQVFRNQLEQLRIQSESLKVKRATHLEQIEQTDYTFDQLKQELPENANVAEWEESIVRIENRITRLGPINLAAIDEYSQLSERKQYLDQQYNDLMEALATLEEAIRKIDRETRIRFKETFTQLNVSFKEYFTQIFGGGDSNLELTSDDLLETGVIVKAQPPGKRNSTIHLLSGGEKALTAIALVFAIFSLNPAPFCVLDEVDAPLDDANVVRFCNLVKKMSEKIQFIFISHNKITIEMGQQLAGVTMQEPGVSRLVSVDIDEAINLAAT